MKELNDNISIKDFKELCNSIKIKQNLGKDEIENIITIFNDLISIDVEIKDIEQIRDKIKELKNKLPQMILSKIH